ncbi:carboxylating nicotinate-nucleotide diphosphorylase [Litoribacillus peritrichatus]|uniref:nicotinate-nucleotide diphosphorylase (carboxylating) n=1 Tax=Litoribacillus peritrichatus TaxID=718191 RepID=A0ABP7M1A3_9GAMM
MTTISNVLLNNIQQSVQQALQEDVGDGDITALLIPENKLGHARIITREPGILCGQAWVNEVFKQFDANVEVIWHKSDGDVLEANDVLFELKGSARSLLTGERCALNFLQTLSATATLANQYTKLVEGTSVTLLDTRKTLPGMRLAQKYAVKTGGCDNHRIGLFDAFLIKENHISAAGGIEQAVTQAQKIAPGKPVEVEVENFEELDQALKSGADIIMLDNFSNEDLVKAVTINKEQFQGKAKLEASGGITQQTLRAKAETGVDYISIGALTKDVKALDLSMRFVEL